MNTSYVYDTPFHLHPDRVGVADPPLRALARRVQGHTPIDPFGLDPQLADIAGSLLRRTVRVQAVGMQHIPESGPAVLVMNRGFGIFEPTALAVALMNETGRRVRVVGAPTLFGLGTTLRRFGSIAASPADVVAALSAGHLVVVPLSPNWWTAGAGTPPLELMQSVMTSAVLPVWVRPNGPLGLATSWRVTIGPEVVNDTSIAPGDPLGAAELSEAVRTAVDNLR